LFVTNSNPLCLQPKFIPIELFPPHPPRYPQPLWTSWSAISVWRAVDLISCAQNWDLDWLLLLDSEQITIHSGFQFHYKCKNAKWQAGHYLRMVWIVWGMVWYRMGWDVCLLIDDRCGRRWSSFVYRLRRTCVSASDPRTSPLGSIHLLLEQLHSQIGANAFEFVWPAAKSIDNQSAPVQFGQPSCQFAQSAQVHSKKLFIYSNFNMKCQLVWNDRELTHIILIYYTHFKKIVFLKDYFCKGILLMRCIHLKSGINNVSLYA